jgi:hypothetical protein
MRAQSFPERDDRGGEKLTSPDSSSMHTLAAVERLAAALPETSNWH